eukprot:TRINITY_DN36899_c0_g1_i2.p1 TRINITY_DN36899_c0_g1~~TRINITY_DN36899_c0_g1_i2.p1  ORF type:complete len:224 (+),score=39.20 TRINITY_DN36899_c0_g1_i2:169-840(+)
MCIRDRVSTQSTWEIKKMKAGERKQAFELHLKALTWNRDSHGLFDYESQSVTKKEFNTSLHKYLIRRCPSGDVILCTNEEVKQEKILHAHGNGSIDVLFQMRPHPTKPNSFLIQNCSSTGIYDGANDKLWTVLKTMKRDSIAETHRLQRGEILKLGRMRIKIKDYRIEDGDNPEDRVSCLSEEGPIDITVCDDLPVDENDCCRICFGRESTLINPLLAPCTLR